MMSDKQILQMLEVLGKNSRRSFAASDVIEGDMKKREDQLCAATIRKIVENSNSNSNSSTRRSFAASASSSTAAAITSPNRNINRAKVLYNFVIKNHEF